MKQSVLKDKFQQYCNAIGAKIERSYFLETPGTDKKYICATPGTLYLAQADARCRGNLWSIMKNGDNGTVSPVYGFVNISILYGYMDAIVHQTKWALKPNGDPENDSRLLVATDDEGNIIFSLLDNNNWNAALKTAIDENYYDRKVEIISISEPDKMMKRRVIIKVAEDGDDPHEITLTLTPAYLYK